MEKPLVLPVVDKPGAVFDHPVRLYARRLVVADKAAGEAGFGPETGYWRWLYISLHAAICPGELSAAWNYIEGLNLGRLPQLAQWLTQITKFYEERKDELRHKKEEKEKEEDGR